MSSDFFARDKRDRKRRFLRGLNRMLGVGWDEIENPDVIIRVECYKKKELLEFRNALANTYCLEFTPEELEKIVENYMTSGEFTQRYVAKVYRDRGRADLNTVIGNSIVECGGKPAISLAEVDKAPKYGLNGSEWCDVASGPCSCGAWH